MWLDTGSFFDADNAAGDMKTNTLIDGMNRLGYGGVNIAERELTVGWTKLQERLGLAQFPTLSSNVVYEDDGEPVFEPWRIVEVEGDDGTPVKLGLLGLSRGNRSFRAHDGEGRAVVTADPRETVEALLPALREAGAQVTIALAYMDYNEARRLAQDVVGLDLILGGYGGRVAAVSQPINGTYVSYGGNQGKRVAELRLYLDEGGELVRVHDKMHYLAEEYPDEPKLFAIQEETRVAVNDWHADNAAPRRRGDLAGPPSYVTSQACQACHEEAFEIWQGTSHSHAFDILVEKVSQFNPECVGCHSTGYERDGGFLNAVATPELAHVGCEACHGPGGVHPAGDSLEMPEVGAKTCVGCHNAENDPDFNFHEYWPKIAH